VTTEGQEAFDFKLVGMRVLCRCCQDGHHEECLRAACQCACWRPDPSPAVPEQDGSRARDTDIHTRLENLTRQIDRDPDPTLTRVTIRAWMAYLEEDADYLKACLDAADSLRRVLGHAV
jgi:hypothetical protein